MKFNLLTFNCLYQPLVFRDAHDFIATLGITSGAHIYDDKVYPCDFNGDGRTDILVTPDYENGGSWQGPGETLRPAEWSASTRRRYQCQWRQWQNGFSGKCD